MNFFAWLFIVGGGFWATLGLVNACSVMPNRMEVATDQTMNAFLFIGHIFLYWLPGSVIAGIGFIMKYLSNKKIKG